MNQKKIREPIGRQHCVSTSFVCVCVWNVLIRRCRRCFPVHVRQELLRRQQTYELCRCCYSTAVECRNSEFGWRLVWCCFHVSVMCVCVCRFDWYYACWAWVQFSGCWLNLQTEWWIGLCAGTLRWWCEWDTYDCVCVFVICDTTPHYSRWYLMVSYSNVAGIIISHMWNQPVTTITITSNMINNLLVDVIATTDTFFSSHRWARTIIILIFASNYHHH